MVVVRFNSLQRCPLNQVVKSLIPVRGELYHNTTPTRYLLSFHQMANISFVFTITCLPPLHSERSLSVTYQRSAANMVLSTNKNDRYDMTLK